MASGTPARPLLLLLPLLLSVVGGAGCITQSTPATPLYSPSDAVPGQQVALLSGYVAQVDLHDVSALGGPFALLPGCHVVTTPTKWGDVSYSGGVIAMTGAVTFALPMAAGRRYAVVVVTGSLNGPSGTVTVRVDETTPAGDPVRSIGPSRSFSETAACLQGS